MVNHTGQLSVCVCVCVRVSVCVSGAYRPLLTINAANTLSNQSTMTASRDHVTDVISDVTHTELVMTSR